jgi:hypothetical protein
MLGDTQGASIGTGTVMLPSRDITLIGPAGQEGGTLDTMLGGGLGSPLIRPPGVWGIGTVGGGGMTLGATMGASIGTIMLPGRCSASSGTA